MKFAYHTLSLVKPLKLKIVGTRPRQTVVDKINECESEKIKIPGAFYFTFC